MSAGLHLVVLNTCPEPAWFRVDGHGEPSTLNSLFCRQQRVHGDMHYSVSNAFSIISASQNNEYGKLHSLRKLVFVLID